MRLPFVLVALAGAHLPAAAQLTPPPAATVVVGAVQFSAHATAGDFTGSTDAVRGAFSAPAGLASATGHVEADAATLVTRNDGRDRHLREALEVERYPLLRFDVERVTPAGTAGDTTLVMLDGSLAIHGVTRPRRVEGRLLAEGAGLRLLASIPVSFREFGIRRHLSKFLGLVTVRDAFTAHVDVTFAPPAR
ncbi:MAG: YceI family protein [Gemmatimonadales bacterium]|nr:YceI family protein [Gemmatimonadales bacterium]